MDRKKKGSLSAKTVRSTVLGCLTFGVIVLFVALTFNAVSLVSQYIRVADSCAHQAGMSATHGADCVEIADQVMEIWRGLSKEQRNKTGTPEYREFFSKVDLSHGSNFDFLVHMMAGSLSYYDVSDVYLGMFDEEVGALIYVVGSDPTPNAYPLPGEWKKVKEKTARKFLHWNGEGKLYDFGWSKKDGPYCMVGLPIKDDNDRVSTFMLVNVSMKDIVAGMVTFFYQLTVVLIIVTIILAWIQTKRINKTLVEPINRIAEASVKYVNDRKNNEEKKEYFANLNIHTGDEIENLSLSMADMERELTEYEANLTKITAEKERIGVELSLATKIQAALLPHDFPAFPDRGEFDLYATMEPAREVGGDFYDFFLIDEDHLCLVMADVSGKGIPAALFMMISKTILKNSAMLGIGAAEVLKRANEALYGNNQVKMFVTVWLGILELSTGRLTAANAGHEYPVLKRAGGKYEIFKDKHGFVIGGKAGMRYQEYELWLGRGDRLFVYTDGVPEASNEAYDMFGMERMVDALNQNPDCSISDVIGNVRTAVGNFVKDAEQFDDLTMMCIEYKGKQDAK